MPSTTAPAQQTVPEQPGAFVLIVRLVFAGRWAIAVLEEKHAEAEEYDLYDPYG